MANDNLTGTNVTGSKGGKPSDRRAGQRKDRNRRVGKRIPEMGYYLIVTDTEATERNYFEGLRDSIPPEFRDRPVIKVEKAGTVALVTKAIEFAGKEPQYRIPWIVFDRDQVKGFDEIVRTAESHGVGAGWSNPCFEIWLYAYFGEMPAIRESYMCCERFAEKFERVTGQKDQKAGRDVYRKLGQYGDLEKAVELAEKNLKKCEADGKMLPSEMWPRCMVHRLVAEIQGKMK